MRVWQHGHAAVRAPAPEIREARVNGDGIADKGLGMTLCAWSRRLCVPLGGWLFVLASACAKSDDPPSDADGSSSSSGTTDQSVDPNPTISSTVANTVADEGPAEASGEGSSDTSSSSSGPPPSDCDPVVQGGFNACLENQGQCGWVPGEDPSMQLTCIAAFSVEGGSVCTITGCVDSCDCFAHPGTGTATVECIDGVLEGHTTCVLYCGGGEVCPDGMVCSVQSCAWPPG